MMELLQKFNDVAPHWADAIWRAAWQGGLAVTAIWVLCSAIPRIPARIRCWLWRLALIKLLMCLVWVTPIKLALLPPAKPQTSVYSSAQAVQRETPARLGVQSMRIGTALVSARNKPKLDILTVVLVFWSLGVTAVLLEIFHQWRQVQLLIRKSQKNDHMQLEIDLARLSREFGLQSMPKIRLTDDLGTPLLAGFRHRNILIPRSFLINKSPSQLQMMLAHELAHVKRHDLGWAWLSILARLLFYFHPLVWVAQKESRLAEEMAADALTVTLCNVTPADYAGMLVEVAARICPPRREELVMGVVSSHQTLKRRLQAMKHLTSTANRRMIASAAMVATVGMITIVPWRIVAQTQMIAGNKSSGIAVPPLQPESPSSKLEETSVVVNTDGHYCYSGRVMELDVIISDLNNALALNPALRIRVQADNHAPFSSLITLLNKINEANITRVSVTTASDPITPQIFNIDFGAWRPVESQQTGPAAAGREGDYWNTVGVAWNNDHTEAHLKFASRDPSPIQVRMVNLAGGWSNKGLMGIKSPMFDSYNYPMNNQGGNAQVFLSQVPPGKYDVYIYGHERSPLACGDYTLTVGNHNYGRKATSSQSDAIENTTWVEGSQYVKFAGVDVAAADTMQILIQPGGQVTDQLNRTFSDATICGLQLIPVK